MAVSKSRYSNNKVRKRRTSAVFFYILIAVHVIPDDFPYLYSNPSSAEYCEIWYDRADLEECRNSWLSSANYGISFLPEEERSESVSEMKKRLAEWQWRKIENKLSPPDMISLIQEIEKKDFDYLYHVENGKVLFDESGDPFFKGLADLGSDLSLWEDELKTYIEKLFREWEEKASVKLDEILSFESGIDSDEKSSLDVSFSEYKECIKKEFEYLYLAGRKSFITRRSRDSFSMKKDSVNRSAEEEAEKIIKEISLSLNEASASLKKNLEAMNNISSEDQGTVINEWDNDFREQFERGLEKWEKAEKDFLAERMRWEREGKEGYIRAEEDWDRAVERFTGARRAWSEEMKGIIEEGRSLWKEREDNFFDSYKKVVEGIEEASIKEKIRFEKEVSGYLSVFRESRNIEKMAEENIEYLRGEIKRIEYYKADKQRSVDRINRDINEIEKDIAGYSRSIENAHKDQEDWLKDHRHSKSSLVFKISWCIIKIRELEPLLPALYADRNKAEAVRDKKNEELSSYRTELDYWINAKADYKTAREKSENSLLALEENINTGIYGADEFESQLNLLKEKRDILERKLQIAEHVYEYSLDYTSGRERMADTEKNYLEASAVFKEKEDFYIQSIKELDNFIENILADNEIELEMKKTELLAAEKILEDAGHEYESAMEIFRLKDSGLLETTISNLENENEDYLESILENVWTDYFLHMEKLLRNEREWAAGELLSDIKGESAEDNAADLEKYEERIRFLLDLNPDFPESDAADLKTKFTLEGFDTETGLVNKFLSSLGDKPKSMFYFFLLKAEAEGELKSVNKGVEILSLDESLKSSSELVLEINDLLSAKRKDLFGDNYKNDNVLSFFKNEPYEKLIIDTADSETMIKIKEIIMLEAEIKGIEKYSPCSAAFVIHERNDLFEKMSNLFCLVDDIDSSGAGFTSFLETSEDLITFYENLKSLNNVPVYIEEITGKILEGLIRSKGFVFNGDLSLLEDEAAVISDRIENHTSEDPLGLCELEEVRNKLSVKIDTLKDLKELQLHSEEKLYSEKEKRIYEYLLVKALNNMKNEIDLITGSETVKDKKNIIILSETEYSNRNKRLADLKEKLSDWEKEQSEYFSNNIADKKTSLENAKNKLSVLRDEYCALLNHFISLTDEYRIKKSAVDAALSEFTESKWILYEAEELRDFAASPYPLTGTDPYSLLQVRKAEFEKADSLYNEILNISKSPGQKPASERFNSDFLKMLDVKKELLSSVNYIGQSSDILARNITRAKEEAGRYYAEMTDSIGSIFRFSLPFNPDIENYSEYELSDFTGITEETDIISAVDAYFNCLNSDAVFSNDALNWAKAVSDTGSDIIREFGIALYSEYKHRISVPLYSDQNYKELKKSKYADCNPEKYADSYSRNILSSIKKDEELNRLYCFFKAMYLSGNTTLDSSFIGKDISRIAHDYLWDRSKSEERHIKKKHWWSNFWKRTARKMRKMRHNMTDLNGSSERNMIWGDSVKIFKSISCFLDKKNEILLLAGGEEGRSVSFDDFIISIEAVSGKLPPEAGSGFKDILRDIYNTLSEEDKSTSYLLSLRIFEQLNILLNAENEKLSVFSELLEEQRAEKISEYQSGLNNPDIRSEEISTQFISLFYNPEYSLKESSQVSLSKLLKSYSHEDDLKGRERILVLSSNELLKFFSSCVDIKRNENDEKIKRQYLELLGKKRLFEERISELYETGVYEWRKSFNELTGRRKKWRDSFKKEAEIKEELWRDKYSILRRSRNRWVEESAAAAQKGEINRLSCEIGINADRLLGESSLIIIPDIRNQPSLEKIIEEVTDSEKLSALITSASYYSTKKESENITLSSYLPSIGSFGGNNTALVNLADKLSDEIGKRAALLQALKTAKTVRVAEDSILENIESANRSTDKSLADTLEGKGYRRKGNIFSRKAVIDMTLFGGIEEEVHEIEAYNYFEAPDFEQGADLSSSSLLSMSRREIELKAEKALTNLKRYAEVIFGAKTAEETAGWKGFDEDFKTYIKKAEKSFTSSRQASEYKNTRGLFYMHLGYSPVMDSREPEKVKTEGYGEYGRIYKLYLRNEARLGRGLASFDVPWYSQKLWDDDKDNDGESDGILGSPSVRSIGNIAMAVASGGAGSLAFAVNMLDDAAFTAMDIGSGITDWDDGLMDLGKQAAAGAAVQGINEGFKIETDSFTAAAGAAGFKTASANLVSTAVNSFDLNSGSLYFNSNTFGQNWKNDLYGKNAVSAYINSMGRAGLDSALTGFYGEDLASGRALSSSIAGTAADIYEYSASGSTKLNLLNTSDLFFGNRKLHDRFGGSGILEIGIGDGGSLFEFGTEGHNASVSQIASSYKGINTYYQNAGISFSAGKNIRKAKAAMRSLYSRGKTDKAASELFTNLLSGKDILELDESLGCRAETVKNNNGGRTVKISSLGDDYYSRLNLGIVLGHESHRDGSDNGVSGQAEETVRSVFAHSEMAMDMERDYRGLIAADKNLIRDVNQYNQAVMSGDISGFAGYVLDNYDISKEYWKVIKHKNGSITMADDGSDNVAIVDEETGEEKLFKYSGGSKTAFIADILGLGRDELNYQMGPETGWSYIDGKWENREDDGTVQFTPAQIEKMNIRFNELNLIRKSDAVSEGIFRKIGKAVDKGRKWISGKYAVVREVFNFKRYIASKAVPDSLSEKYYERGDILPADLIRGGFISQTAHEDDTHLLRDWHTKGHPAVDITGKGMISFPYDLELLKTGKNRNRLLYRVAGSNDYIYFTHINPSESDALQKILEKSSTESVLYKAGTSLFSYPKEVDDYSTDLHIHMEMYRKKNDGSYSFANPLTGEFLPDFGYMHSDDGDLYEPWRKKLPSKYNYWR